MIKDHEKFWAFLALGFAVLLLVAIVTVWPPEKDQVIRVVDSAVGGFLLALGAAANALFRIGTPGEEEQKKLTAETAKVVAEKMPDPPKPVQPVTVENPPSSPVPVEPATHDEAAEELPEYAR